MALETRKDVEKWLEDQSKEVAVVFAARAALRAVPYFHSLTSLTQPFDQSASGIILPSFYGMATALSVGTGPDRAVDSRGADAAATYASHGAARSAAAYAALAAAYAASFAANDAAYAARAAAPYAADDLACAAAYWLAFNDDHTHIQGGGTARTLANLPLWNDGWSGAPNAIQAKWRDLHKLLRGTDQNWSVWTNWYENRIKGVSLDGQGDLEFAKLDYLTEQYDVKAEKFRKPTAEINAELQQLTDAFWKMKGDEEDSETGQSQVPAVYQFIQVNGKLHAHLTRQTPSQATADDARMGLLDLCRSALRSLVGNFADDFIISTLEKIITDLECSIDDFSAAHLNMGLPFIDGLAAAYMKPGVDSYPTINGLLLGVSKAGDNFLGYFNELKFIEAERLALKMQSADAEVVEAHIQDAIQVIEKSNKVTPQTIAALKDGEQFIRELDDRINRYGDDISTELIVERGRLVSLRVLTYMNFLLATVEATKIENSKPKKENELTEVVKEGALSGLKKGTEDLTKDAVKGGFKVLYESLKDNIAEISKYIPRIFEFLN